MLKAFISGHKAVLHAMAITHSYKDITSAPCAYREEEKQLCLQDLSIAKALVLQAPLWKVCSGNAGHWKFLALI